MMKFNMEHFFFFVLFDQLLLYYELIKSTVAISNKRLQFSSAGRLNINFVFPCL